MQKSLSAPIIPTAPFLTPKGDKPTDDVSQRQMDRYLAKISGPLIDRIDLHVEVPPVPFAQLSGRRSGTDSATLRSRVVAARAVQAQRNGGPLRTNRTLNGRELDRLAALPPDAAELLKQAMADLGLSARAYDKVRRVARTIADLEQSPAVALPHVAEAVQYRLLDRQA